ncbi:MAG: MarR family transcriptional regulator [Clostridiales bacterium]|nr:MarR family transcriptional regulator [Clostridiales bacterium]MDY4172179.1 MarR family transcriptional regulator [Evtepia sp.]
MTANYEGLAAELLQVNEALLQDPTRRLLSQLTKGEHFVLNYLLTHQSQTHPAQLSRHMAVSTARVAALLGRMEDKGLLSRVPDPLNNRQVNVTLSPQGLQAIQAFRSQVLSATTQMLAQLGPEDAREYLRLQKKLLSRLPLRQATG